MGKITQLSDHLANMIAAGEVVERPSSVVKELVENSIDAGAKNIKVKLLDSGTKLINVIDDGEGMTAEDALLAFGRHATSKIKNEYDLFRIHTLGFRGEAIPSIASVSKMTILTSTGLDNGYKVEYNAGKKIYNGPEATNKGTNISVENLFFNTPARLKYLKSLNTELASVSNFMMRFALANPFISFSLENNDRSILRTSGTGDLTRLFGEVYGVEVARNLLISEFKSIAFNLKLAIAKSTISRSTKNEITIICNGRYVKSYKISDALIEAYNTYIPHTRYPIGVIYLTVEPLLLDVNIHPSKAIIKISNEDEIASKVLEMARALLKEANMIPDVVEPIKYDEYKKESLFNNDFDNTPLSEKKMVYNEKSINDKVINNISSNVIGDIETREDRKTTDVTYEEKEENLDPPSMQKTKRLPYLEYVGQVHGTYLIFQNDEGMYLVDQHAAAERINYEKYYKILSSPQTISNDLLIPYIIEFNPSEMIFIEEHLEELLNIGISLSQYSKNSYAVRSTPYWMDFDHIDEFIRNMLSDFARDKKISIIKNRDRISKQIACKDSIKANHFVSIEEAYGLIKQLNTCNNPYTCPHGRPTIIKITKTEIEKLFLRIM